MVTEKAAFRTMSSITYAQKIEAHYAENWRAPRESLRWGTGPIDELPADFRVLVVSRSADTVAFATRCMSVAADADRLEIHVLCRPNDVRRTNLPEILTAVAHYHRTGSRLGLGHSVNFGMPWMVGSACTHGVISLPYVDGPKLEWLAEPPVRFLWMIPATPAEIAFKRERGLEALEERFEAAQFNYLDPLRPSVV
ncbi:MAG: suppressor of fused domain protein [Myxococcales bacterium]|nr:suppressor of fused domain protein [Myxococcales bacterium]